MKKGFYCMKCTTFKIVLTRGKLYTQCYYLKICCTSSKQIFNVFYINYLNCSLNTIKKTISQLKPIFQGNKNRAKQNKTLK